MAYSKRPDEVKDYSINWARALLIAGEDVGDTVSSSTWEVETGITKDSDSETTTTTTIWLSGGTADVEYTITNHVVTSQGREYEESIKVNVSVPPVS